MGVGSAWTRQAMKIIVCMIRSDFERPHGVLRGECITHDLLIARAVGLLGTISVIAQMIGIITARTFGAILSRLALSLFASASMIPQIYITGLAPLLFNVRVGLVLVRVGLAFAVEVRLLAAART